jgi:2-polyprenyl-6-methoxyphenol hydroxylase-like FAD-dependent oxidoreductase
MWLGDMLRDADNSIRCWSKPRSKLVSSFALISWWRVCCGTAIGLRAFAAATRVEVSTYIRKNRVIFSFLTNDNLFAIFIGWPIIEFSSVKADIEGQFMRAVDLIPGFAERVRSGRREERFYGAADLPNFLRRPFGPGWALVGDAGCHKDPMMAQGICDAFRDADFLSTAIHEGLAEQCALDEALKRYERRRNEVTMTEPLGQHIGGISGGNTG